MSTDTTKNPTNSHEPEIVMVRAFGGEPVEMLVVRRQGSNVEVARRLGGETLALPSTMVRRLNRSLMSKLQEAFKAKRRGDLNELWAESEPIDLTTVPESEG